MYLASCDGCETPLENHGDESFATAFDRDDILATAEMKEWTIVKGPYGMVKLYCDKKGCQKKAKKG